MKDVLLVVDLGTTSIKCLAFDLEGSLLCKSVQSNCTVYPHPGWVEQDPDYWWAAACKGIRECIALLNHIPGSKIAGISFAGQMSAPVFLDKNGYPLCSSILVADVRSAVQSKWLNQHMGDQFLSLTSNRPIDAFTVCKLLWLKETHPDLYNQVNTFLLPKDYLRYRLTDRLATDPTDASNTLLYQYGTLQWNNELICACGLSPNIFPEIIPSASICGIVTSEASQATGLPQGTPAITGAADMACSQIGSGALDSNCLAITLSTSIQMVAASNIPKSEDNDGAFTYHQSVVLSKAYKMASIFSGGSGAEYAYRLLYGKDEGSLTSHDYTIMSDAINLSRPSPVLFMPFLTGSGSPHFNNADLASWVGISASTTRHTMMQSALEGIGYNIRENLLYFDNQHKNITLGGG
ncbi:MAG: FGGY family carbohydrate kinase, partial [Defluviitaleaceae bacterium]|nr:FGGY family carbohydrate kinase [Defluviitaleaceae bacterium]